MKMRATIAALALASVSAPALAEPITEGVWKLENNETHSLGSAGFYRYNGSGYDLYDFETNGADVRMVYDAAAGTISLAGDAYDPTDDRLVSFDLQYSGVAVEGSRVQIGDSTAVGVFDGVDVMSKGMAGRTLYLDSDGLETSLTGHGWLGTDTGHFGDFHISGTRIADLNDLNPQNPLTGTTGTSGGGGGGTVAAPGGLALLLFGGLAIAGMRRRRTRAE